MTAADIVRALAPQLPKGVEMMIPTERELAKFFQPVQELTHARRMEVLTERNAKAEFYCYCGIGLLILFALIRGSR